MSKRKEEFGEDGQSGTRRFKEKHSLDSDEEDETKEEQLDDSDIEGQEEGTVDYDDGVRITPFNMREEMEEGHFDKDGMYIFSKDKNAIKDEWMDNIDWQQIKEKQEMMENSDDDDDDDKPDKIDLKLIYSQMLEFLKPGETIVKALRRLGKNKGKPMSSAQRWKNKKQNKEETEEDKQAAKDKEDFLTLTGLADKVLQDGNMEVYEMTQEKLNYELKKFDKGGERVPVNTEGMDDDDALDMFADDLDKTEADKIGKDFDNVKDSTNNAKTAADEKETKDTKEEPSSSEVMWEFKWEDKEDDEIHGPHSSSEMLKWADEGFFKSGVFCRKVGTDSHFYSSRRIDFDLYT